MGGIVGACLYWQSNAHTDTQFHSCNIGINSANTKLSTSITHPWFLSWDVQSLHWILKDKDHRPSYFAFMFISFGGKCNKKGQKSNMLICVCGTKRKASVCLHVYVCLCTCPCTCECVSVREVKVILDFKFISSAGLWCPALSSYFPATKPLPRPSYPSCMTNLPSAQDHVVFLFQWTDQGPLNSCSS